MQETRLELKKIFILLNIYTFDLWIILSNLLWNSFNEFEWLIAA